MVNFRRARCKYPEIVEYQFMGNSTDKHSAISDGSDVHWDNPALKKVVFRNNTLETQIPVHNKKDYDDWVSGLNRNPASTSKYAFNPLKNEYKENGMCGSGGTAKITYDGYPYLLSQDIANRQNLEMGNYKESELWYLLYSISSVAKRFHESGYKVGDIRPQNVTMSEHGEVQLTHMFSWPDQKTNYEKALYKECMPYLSPEELKDLSIGKAAPDTNFEQSESFSAGLTLLDAALLTDSHKLYDKKQNFDYEALNGDKVNLASLPGYSNELKHAIMNLTEFEPEDRETLTHINRWLEPYEHDILQFKPFRPGQFPEKYRTTATNNPIKPRVLNFESDNTFNTAAVNLAQQGGRQTLHSGAPLDGRDSLQYTESQNRETLNFYPIQSDSQQYYSTEYANVNGGQLQSKPMESSSNQVYIPEQRATLNTQSQPMHMVRSSESVNVNRGTYTAAQGGTPPQLQSQSYQSNQIRNTQQTDPRSTFPVILAAQNGLIASENRASEQRSTFHDPNSVSQSRGSFVPSSTVTGSFIPPSQVRESNPSSTVTGSFIPPSQVRESNGVISPSQTQYRETFNSVASPRGSFNPVSEVRGSQFVPQRAQVSSPRGSFTPAVVPPQDTQYRPSEQRSTFQGERQSQPEPTFILSETLQTHHTKPIIPESSKNQQIYAIPPRPTTETKQIPGGPTLSYRPKSNTKTSPIQTSSYSPSNTQRQTQQVQQSTTYQQVKPSYGQSQQTHNSYSTSFNSPRIGGETYENQRREETNYSSEHNTFTQRSVSREKELPPLNPESSTSLNGETHRYTSYHTSSNVPTSPRAGSRGGDDLLKRIEDKIKYSRSHFPNDS